MESWRRRKEQVAKKLFTTRTALWMQKELWSTHVLMEFLTQPTQGSWHSMFGIMSPFTFASTDQRWSSATTPQVGLGVGQAFRWLWVLQSQQRLHVEKPSGWHQGIRFQIGSNYQWRHAGKWMHKERRSRIWLSTLFVHSLGQETPVSRSLWRRNKWLFNVLFHYFTVLLWLF